MQMELLSTQDKRWREMLAGLRHDVYHLPEYCSLCAGHEGGVPAAVYATDDAGNKFLLPIIIRPVPFGAIGQPLFDATSPFGYPGPLVKLTDSGEAWLKALGSLLKDFLRNNKIISLFCRLHPILDVPRQSFELPGTVVQHGETVSLDLSVTDAEGFSQMSRCHRREINKARDRGYLFVVDETWRYLDEFTRIYAETMRRCDAEPFYYFSRDYFSHLRDIAGFGVQLCVLLIGDRVAAAAVVSEIHGIVQGHQSATANECVSHNPTVALYDFIGKWARQRGNRLFHLGSGVGGKRDSLFDFKAKFSRLRHPLCTWRLITDETVYSKLVKQWERRTGSFPDGEDGFFPAYRKPIRNCTSVRSARGE
ncbi:MAG: GNAT family N-acetyltransferase [Negativicutes bacterium]|nr:GNAT family N-acetyltransferase [Negativicutes bacterium]